MYRWRNVMCPDGEPDAEIRAIDEVEDALMNVEPIARRIRALISRVDPLSHYKALENVDFLLAAIGDMDYPGSPAVDVLWRQGALDEERRAEVRAYIDALTAWLQGRTEASAAADAGDWAHIVEHVYVSLGEPDETKRWLVLSLRKTLKEHAYTPWDFIREFDDAMFVRAVYRAVLGRFPSEDDLRFRLEELTQGKSREAFLQEILDAPEHRRRHLVEVAACLKRGDT
jgi:hypothetical protein